jgi:phospholipid/cholesterol/gamma-HCH transport system substrate-binding protein
LVETAKPATKNLAQFLADLRPVLDRSIPFFHNLNLSVARPGFANDTQELLATLPAVQERASKAFPNAEAAIASFQPNLNFLRPYVPDLLNGLGRVGQVTGNYDGNGNYARVTFSVLNLFKYESGSGVLEPITPGEQFDALAPPSPVRRPCPGGASQPAADGSSPFFEPAFPGAGVNSAECNPSDVPPGP